MLPVSPFRQRQLSGNRPLSLREVVLWGKKGKKWANFKIRVVSAFRSAVCWFHGSNSTATIKARTVIAEETKQTCGCRAAGRDMNCDCFRTG